MAQSPQKNRTEAAYDLAIAGGGTPGLTLALAVKSAMGDQLRVGIFDPSGFSIPAGAGQADLRASAIAAGVRHMFETLGIWQNVEPDAQPIHEMIITDTALEEPVRPALLSFGGSSGKTAISASEPFAHMVPNYSLTKALIKANLAAGVDLVKASVTSFEEEADRVSFTSQGDTNSKGDTSNTAHTSLLVAADGGRSRLREQAGIPFYGWGYGQTALVATIAHERPHEGRAIEHFLPAGPFAILPLTGNRSSIVWTEREADAKRLLAMEPEFLLRELERRFGLEWGEISLLTPLQGWPLTLGLAKRFIGERFALLGDAAHVIHPIAGQGLNLGLKDAASLAERIVDQARLGLDIGETQVLEAYQRDRRFDTSTMAVTTDILNRLFSNDTAAIRVARSLGLGMVERFPAAKRFFIGEAAAFSGTQPRLLSGQQL